MVDFKEQPLGLLPEVASRELVHILESLPGTKDLVVDPTLLRPLDRVANMGLLRAHGVQGVLPLKTDSVIAWNPQVTRRVYLLRSALPMASYLARLVRSEPNRQIAVVWVDRKLPICTRELERQGAYGLVEEFEWTISLISIETDLFSLELPATVTAGTGDVYSSAYALWQLQSLYGQIPTVYGIGEKSMKTWKMVRRIYAERGEPHASADQPISHLFVVDRDIDKASVFLTALTYESMLHDFFTIGCGKISFGPEVEQRMKPTQPTGSGAQPETTKAKVVVLDNNDGVFASVRNRHMTAVFPFLSAKAKEIQESYNRGTSINKVDEMKRFVSSELRALKAEHKHLETHICACEVVLDKTSAMGSSQRLAYEHGILAGTASLSEVFSYLEDMLLKGQSPWQALMIACLSSLCNNGLPSKILHIFKESVLACCGYELLPVLHTLTRKGLLLEKAILGKGGQNSTLSIPLPLRQKENQGAPSLPFLIRRLSLVPTSPDVRAELHTPNNMNYVFSGAYTPVLCQVVSDTMVHGWNTAELHKTFNGQVFVEENSYVPADRKPDSRMRKAIMVFFVGGVTYAEVAALRLLAVQNSFRILILATNIIHRESYMRALAEAQHTPI